MWNFINEKQNHNLCNAALTYLCIAGFRGCLGVAEVSKLAVESLIILLLRQEPDSRNESLIFNSQFTKKHLKHLY